MTKHEALQTATQSAVSAADQLDGEYDGKHVDAWAAYRDNLEDTYSDSGFSAADWREIYEAFDSKFESLTGWSA